MDENGDTFKDGTSDLGRISRQQDFLRRTLQAALNKGVFDPAVARALITSLQKDIEMMRIRNFNGTNIIVTIRLGQDKLTILGDMKRGKDVKVI